MGRLKAKNQKEQFCFHYRTGTRVWLICFAAFLLILLPIAWMDRAGAWINGVPVIFLVSLIFALYFIYILVSESNQVVEVRKNSIWSSRGIGPFRKTVEIPLEEVTEFREDSTLFSLGRKYSVIGQGNPPARIRLSSTLVDVRELHRLILRRIPRDKVSQKALKSLQRNGIIS